MAKANKTQPGQGPASPTSSTAVAADQTAKIEKSKEKADAKAGKTKKVQVVAKAPLWDGTRYHEMGARLTHHLKDGEKLPDHLQLASEYDKEQAEVGEDDE